MERNTFMAIAGCFFIISILLLNTAIVTNLWTEFLVTELHLAVCAVGALLLLRTRAN